jgi:hypothetical protein
MGNGSVITVRPRLARARRRGGVPSWLTEVSREAKPGEQVTLNWHSDVQTTPKRLDYVWSHINGASAVHVTGGRQVQREDVMLYLLSRQMPATIQWQSGRVHHSGRASGAQAPGGRRRDGG